MTELKDYQMEFLAALPGSHIGACTGTWQQTSAFKSFLTPMEHYIRCSKCSLWKELLWKHGWILRRSIFLSPWLVCRHVYLSYEQSLGGPRSGLVWEPAHKPGKVLA